MSNDRPPWPILNRLDATVLRDPTWWQWTVTVGLLVGHLLGCPLSLAIAVVGCLAFAGVDLHRRRGDLRAMSVQIRLGYSLLLVAGTLPGLMPIHLVQVVGTSARVVVGYCLLERLLRLMPWNRHERLTLAHAWRTLRMPAGPGGVVRLGTGTTPCACSDRGAARPACALPPRRGGDAAAASPPPHEAHEPSPPGAMQRVPDDTSAPAWPPHVYTGL